MSFGRLRVQVELAKEAKSASHELEDAILWSSISFFQTEQEDLQERGRLSRDIYGVVSCSPTVGCIIHEEKLTNST